MASTSDRAAKRTSARRSAQQRPSSVTVPDLVEQPSDDPEEPTGPAMGSESLRARRERPQTEESVSRATSANLSARRAAGGLALPQARRSPGALARPQEDLTRQVDQSDLVIPKIKISQAMSKTNMLHAQTRGKEGVGMGFWYHTTTGRNLGESICFIPVDMRKSRSMFIQGQGLVCRSFDLLKGEGDPGILCEGTDEERALYAADERGCEYRLWSRTPTENKPPPCGVTYNYPGLVIVDIDNPAESEILQGILQLRSSSVQAAKDINTAVMTYGGGVWHSLIFELSSESKSNTKGTFFVPQVEMLDRTDSPEYEKVARQASIFARGMGSRDIRTSLENEADQDGPF